MRVEARLRRAREIARTEHAQRVVREDLTQRLLVEAGFGERGAQARKSAGISKLCWRVNVALEIRADRYVVQPGDLRQVLHLGHHVAERRTPAARQERAVKIHADHAAGLGYPAQLLVSQVPRVVGECARVRVRRNDYPVRFRGKREHTRERR